MLFRYLIVGIAVTVDFFKGDLFFNSMSSMSSFILPFSFSFFAFPSFLFDLSWLDWRDAIARLSFAGEDSHSFI